MKKAYIVGGDRFGETGVLGQFNISVVENMRDADFVVFTGGEDINPELYGEAPHPYTHFSKRRDDFEIASYHQARKLEKPMLGICRGAQLLNVLAGGSLFQHVNNHSGHHLITTDTGETFFTTSVHHQMMRPTKDAEIKAWAEQRASIHEHVNEAGEVVDVPQDRDPEIVVYRDQKMVLVQGHPEFSQTDPKLQDFRNYVFNLVFSL